VEMDYLTEKPGGEANFAIVVVVVVCRGVVACTTRGYDEQSPGVRKWPISFSYGQIYRITVIRILYNVYVLYYIMRLCFVLQPRILHNIDCREIWVGVFVQLRRLRWVNTVHIIYIIIPLYTNRTIVSL